MPNTYRIELHLHDDIDDRVRIEEGEGLYEYLEDTVDDVKKRCMISPELTHQEYINLKQSIRTMDITSWVEKFNQLFQNESFIILTKL